MSWLLPKSPEQKLREIEMKIADLEHELNSHDVRLYAKPSKKMRIQDKIDNLKKLESALRERIEGGAGESFES